MTNSDYWREPLLAGAEHLVGALGRLRTTFRWKADDFEAARLQTRVGASSLTLSREAVTFVETRSSRGGQRDEDQ
jgi:hypothetical protein